MSSKTFYWILAIIAVIFIIVAIYLIKPSDNKGDSSNGDSGVNGSSGSGSGGSGSGSSGGGGLPGPKTGEYAKVVSDQSFFLTQGTGKIGLLKPTFRLKILEQLSNGWSKIETNEYYDNSNAYKYSTPAKQGYIRTWTLVRY